MSHVIFETERLLVRHLEPSDESTLLAVYSDADAMRWVDDGEPITPEECREWIEVTQRNYRTRGYGMSALVDRSSGETIGFCGLVHPGGQSEVEIKYALARAHWGRGLATEAVVGMLRYGRERLRLRHIIATVAPENEASRRVLTKAGLLPSGFREEADGTRTEYFEWNEKGEPWVRPSTIAAWITSSFLRRTSRR